MFLCHTAPPLALFPPSFLPSISLSPSINLSSLSFSSSLADCQTKGLGLSDELPCVALYLTNADSRQRLKQQINR